MPCAATGKVLVDNKSAYSPNDNDRNIDAMLVQPDGKILLAEGHFPRIKHPGR
ncbi:hypothetical protein GCM10027398_00960 [Azotobacter salinestris]